jgi:hypothetical protein
MYVEHVFAIKKRRKPIAYPSCIIICAWIKGMEK